MTERPWIVKPGWAEACLCGSGKKFGSCCRNRLPDFDIGKKYSAACEARNWELALLATRADITQYTIWHKSHTERVLPRNPTLGLLLIDVDALAAYVERLFWLYMNTGRKAAWLDTLDRLGSNIKNIRWRRKIAYFRALFYIRPDGNNIEARRELRKAGPITAEETDVELLQIHLDLEWGEKSFSERLLYLDQILKVSKSLGDQMQYRGAKAIQYFLIGDKEAAARLFAEVVKMGRDPEYQPLGRRQKDMFASSLQNLGGLKDDRALLEQSIGLFHELLLEGDWTKQGEASLHGKIGGSYKFLGDWAEVEAAHRTALSHFDNSIDRIHLSEALLYQNKIAEASSEIDRIEQQSLEGSAREDFVFAYATIALWSEDANRLDRARSLLESFHPTAPYFIERRLNLLVSISKGISAGKISSEAKKESAPKGGFLSLFSSIVMLQPNIAGIGLNLNAILDYLAQKKRPTPPTNIGDEA